MATFALRYQVEKGIRSLPESSWRPVFDRSVNAYFEGELDEGTAACLALLNAVGVPDEIRERTYQNQFWYARPLSELVPRAEWFPLELNLPEGWSALDPSPAAAGDRFTVVLRATIAEPAGEGRLDPLTSRLNDVDVVALPEATGTHRLSELRPFDEDDAWRLAAIVRDPSGEEHAKAGVLPLLGGDPSGWRLLDPRPGDFRQGWSPVVTASGAHFVAWWEPTEVFRLDEETGTFERVALRMAPHIAERFQGGSQGVPVPGGFLFLVNEAVTLANGERVTFSRFVRLDAGFQIRDISHQFFLEGRGRDSASGLARQGDRLIAGFTAGETTPLLATMDLEAVLGVLIPVASPGPPADRSP